MTAVKTATNNPNHLLHVSDITLNMLQWHRHDRLTLTLVLSHHTHTHTCSKWCFSAFVVRQTSVNLLNLKA